MLISHLWGPVAFTSCFTLSAHDMYPSWDIEKYQLNVTALSHKVQLIMLWHVRIRKEIDCKAAIFSIRMEEKCILEWPSNTPVSIIQPFTGLDLCGVHPFNSSAPIAIYIYASVNRVNIGSDNGMSPFRRQAISQTSVGLLSNGTTSMKFWSNTKFSLTKMHLKILFAKRWPFCQEREELATTITKIYWDRRGYFEKWPSGIYR